MLTLATSIAAASGAAQLRFRKSRGSIGAEADVQNGDALMYLNAQAYSAGYMSTAEIDFMVDAVVVSGQRPASRIDFYTNANNAAPVVQLSIDRNGNVLFSSGIAIGSASPTGTVFRVDTPLAILTGTTQSGIVALVTFNASAVNVMRAGYFKVNSAAGAYSTTIVEGIRIDSPTFGASHTPGTVYGLRVSNQSGGGTANYAIETGTGSVKLGDLAGSGSRLVQADANGLLSAATALSALYQVLWTKTASTAVANTGTETTLLDTGVGSKTLAAAFFTVGKTLFFEVVGFYSNLLTPTLQFKMKLGSTVILDSGAILTPGTVTNQQFRFRGQMTCRTTGATGTVMAQGEVVLAGLSTPMVTVTNTGTNTIDTTGTLVADVTLTWGTANAANTATATNSTIEGEG